MGIDRAGMRGILLNTGWLFFDKVVRLAFGVVVSVWIARYLGPSDYGVLSYALSFVAILGSVAGLGLDSLVVRELIGGKRPAEAVLGTACVLRLTGGVVTVALCLVAVLLVHPGDTRLLFITLTLSVGFIFQSLDVIEYWFQAGTRSKHAVISRSMAFFFMSCLKIFAIVSGASLIVFAMLSTLEFLMMGLSLAIAYVRRGGKLIRWTFDPIQAKIYLADGWPLALSGMAIIVYMKIDQIMIGKMLGVASVGTYAAAVRLVELWYVIPMALTASAFPAIFEAKSMDPSVYRARLQALYDVLAWIGLGIGLIVSLFSGFIITVLYGEDYSGAAPVLALYVWSAVATFLGVASSQFLVAENYTRVSLYRTLLGMISNFLLNVWLIPAYGISGAATATVISYSVATFSLVLFTSTREQSLMLLKSLFFVRLFRSRVA